VTPFFDHVMIRVSGREDAETFYRPLLAALGREPTAASEEGGVAKQRGRALAVRSRRGATERGAPGLRPECSPDYYGGFLLDPDGNGIEAVHHRTTSQRDQVDHI
jgi:catechol-2,3-dioxygenase